MPALETKELGPQIEAKQIVEAVRSELDAGLKKYETKHEELAATVAELNKKAADRMTSEESLTNHFKNLSDEIAKLTPRIDRMDEEFKDAVRGGIGQHTKQVESVTQQLVNNDQFKAFIAGQTNRVRVETKAAADFNTGTGSAGVGKLLVPERRAGIIESPVRPLTVRDLLPASPMGAGYNSFQFVKEVATIQGGPAMVAEGALKPQISFDLEDDEVSVRTIAHWARINRQALSDVGFLQNYIEGRMQVQLDLKEEDQLLTGDGTGQNLTGLIPNATTYVDPGILPATGIQMVDDIRAAKLQVRLAYYAADSVVMNPLDWAKLELIKDAQDRYIFSAFQSGATPRIWGLRVVESDAIPEGHFLVGSFSLAAEIRDRESSTIDISNSDQDNFVKNKVTILNEKRLCLAIYRPASFVYGTFS